MFFACAVIAMFAYAIHGVWMTNYYRRHDALAVVTLRGLGLSIVMLPGLAVAGWSDIAEMGAHLPPMLVAAGTALVSNCAAALSVRYLPIGIAAALNMSLATLVSTVLSNRVLHETPSAGQLAWMSLIFVGVLGLGATRSQPAALPAYSVTKGLLCALTVGLCIGTGFTLIGVVSRDVHPLVVGYCWEFTIMVFGFAAMLARRLATGGMGLVPGRRDVGRIVLYCTAGGVGTSCYAVAVGHGSVGVVSAILSTTMVVTSIIARLTHDEKLTARQWLLIALVTAAVIGLKAASGA